MKEFGYNAESYGRKKYLCCNRDDLIKQFCESKGIKCVNTGKAPTAIDRVKLFSDKINADAYINVQGDEPIVNQMTLIRYCNITKNFPTELFLGKLGKYR